MFSWRETLQRSWLGKVLLAAVFIQLTSQLAAAQVTCPANDAEQCNRRGYFAMKDKRWRDARQFLSHACKLGLAKSCNNLGWVYVNLENIPDAIESWKKACSLNHPRACQTFDKYSAEKPPGDSQQSEAVAVVKPILEEAKSRANDNEMTGISREQCMKQPVATCLELGIDLIAEKEYGPARKILAALCGQGFGKACGGMGFMSEVIDDWTNAVRYYDRSCRSNSAGSGESCHRLGNYFSSQSDPKQAEVYFHHACEQGYRVSCVLLEREPALIINDE